jgi:hypothetical protein
MQYQIKVQNNRQKLEGVILASQSIYKLPAKKKSIYKLFQIEITFLCSREIDNHYFISIYKDYKPYKIIENRESCY